MINRVEGFLFSSDYKRMALIRKIKGGHVGKAQGIASQVIEGHRPERAMINACKAIAGINGLEWKAFAEIKKEDSHTRYYAAIADVDNLDMAIYKVWVVLLNVPEEMTLQLTYETMWLIALALYLNSPTSKA